MPATPANPTVNPISDLGVRLQRLPAPLPMWRALVDREQWLAAAQAVAAVGGRLVSMWGVDRGAAGQGMLACAALATAEGLSWLELPLGEAKLFPDLSSTFACAGRMQRAMADLSGLRAQGATDARPWLSHGLWAGTAPLQQSGTGPAGARPAAPAR